jgi:hypothetical protein
MKLGSIEPFLHGEGLRCPVFLQQFGEVFHRHLRLFVSDDLHSLIFGDGGSVVSSENPIAL